MNDEIDVPQGRHDDDFAHKVAYARLGDFGAAHRLDGHFAGEVASVVHRPKGPLAQDAFSLDVRRLETVGVQHRPPLAHDLIDDRLGLLQRSR